MVTRFGTGIAKGWDGFEIGKKAAEEALSKIGGKADLCIVFLSSKYNYDEVIKGIGEATKNAPLIGCSTAGEFTEERVENGSVAVGAISSDSCKFLLGMGEELKDDPLGCVESVEEQIKVSKEDEKNFPNKSLLILGDGLAGRGEELVSSAMMTFDMNLIGGTAGDDFKMKETHVFMNDKVRNDAVSVCEILSKVPIAFGVKHGHVPISPLLEITKASENVVYEIDNKPAWEVWKEYCRDCSKEDIGVDLNEIKTQEEKSRILTVYEMGIQTGEGYVIRWPGSSTKEDNSLTFATIIPEKTGVAIMRSTKESQINSAREAAEVAISKIGKESIAGALIFDCGVRGVMLGDDFYKAIDEIKDVLGVPILGFETYGEIGMKVGDIAGFHHTTTVVVLIPK